MVVSIDMFSLLPEALLSIIVSLLPFKDAVRTSSLSKSWLNIYKFTRNIEFNELFFVKSNQNVETRQAQRRAFLDFITFWIDNHRVTAVDKFSLRLSKPETVGEIIQRCTAFATQYGVKELELDFSDSNWNETYFEYYEALFELPSHVYGHSGLEKLKLYSCSIVETDLLHNFHALKEVSLGWMQVRLTTIKTLLSNCKMLESLSMKKCWNADNFIIGDENLRLRKLILDKCDLGVRIFNVKAPNLRLFNYSGLMYPFAVEVHSPVMVEAYLDFSLESGFHGLGPLLYRIMENFYTVRVLTVCNFVLQVIPSGDQTYRMQRDMNVRHLTMKSALHPCEFLGITFFLNSCPVLESVTIELGFPKVLFGYVPPYDFDEKRFWTDNRRIYKCMRTTLKEVVIKGFRGTMNELRFIKYLIINGKVLKKITINLLKDDVDGEGESLEYYRREVADSMLMVPRASSNLEISIC